MKILIIFLKINISKLKSEVSDLNPTTTDVPQFELKIKLKSNTMLKTVQCQLTNTGKNRVSEREITDRHHEKNPLVTSLSIQTNNSSRWVADYSVEKPSMIT
jgi:hypothetical protein